MCLEDTAILLSSSDSDMLIESCSAQTFQQLARSQNLIILDLNVITGPL